MTEQSGLIKKTLRRTIPLELRSYLTRRPSTTIDQATWDREYAAGEWSKLGKLDEMPRYALVSGYIRTIGATASVLDVGCGEGNLSHWLFESGSRRCGGSRRVTYRHPLRRVRDPRTTRGLRWLTQPATFDPGEQFEIIVLNRSALLHARA